MLRDRDIYILDALVDWVTNQYSRSGATWKHRDFIQLNGNLVKNFLNQLANAVQASAFKDNADAVINGQWTLDSEARDWFLIDTTLTIINNIFSTSLSFADQAERDAFRANMLDELGKLQPISVKYPNGEPIPFEDRLTFTEVTNLPGSLYPTARIYEVQ